MCNGSNSISCFPFFSSLATKSYYSGLNVRQPIRAKSVTIRNLLILSLLVSAAILVTWTPVTFAQHSQAHTQKKKVTQVAPVYNHLPGDTVGVVNGDVITYADFNSIMSGYLKAFVKRSGDNVVTDSLYSIIVDSAWHRAVSDILTEQEIQKRKLAMTDSEAKNAIIQDPPVYLRKQFTDSTGAFHSENISQALNDPRNDSIVRIIIVGEKIRLETDRLIASLDRNAHSSSEKNRAYDAWLKRMSASAKIVDKRLSFGFY